MIEMRILVRLALPGFLFVSLAGFVNGQDSIRAFRYQPKRVDVGVVYHYLKTNIDGTVPEHVSIYVAAKDRIESFKFHPKGARAGLVIATMDWTIFSATRLESWQVYADKDKVLAATLNYSKPNRGVVVELHFMSRPPEKVKIPYLPFHVYNFDLASLNFAFRHLVNNQEPFKVGISDPTFSESGPSFRYRGEVEIKYAGEEIRGDVLCNRYRIDGSGVENRGGTIWVARNGGHFQDVEIELPDNPNWQSFKFKLKKTERINQSQWEKFMKAQF